MTDYTPVSASQHGKTIAIHYENEKECTLAFAVLSDDILAAFPRLKQERDELLAALKLATHELVAIRARDGAPQHIDWERGNPIQVDGCSIEWWNELTEKCEDLIAKVEK